MNARQNVRSQRRAGRLSKWFLPLIPVVIGLPALQAQVLPDAPSALMEAARQTVSAPAAQAPQPVQSKLPADIAAPDTHPVEMLSSQPPCERVRESAIPEIPWLLRSPTPQYRAGAPCRSENPLQQIISARDSPPLTPELKGFLAIRNVADPFNLLTIAAYSGIVIAANSHSAYGPGFGGWGKLAGYSVLEDMQTEFFGTFAIPSIVHEDPRYHRMPDATIKRRILHAVVHTVISQHDDGTPMINYATLLTYPISAELSNLYVPGIGTNASSTAKRIVAGYATDPIGPLIAEFLPDIAKHIHIHVVLVQEILQKVATGQANTTP